jgi:hypothetical protein
MNYSIEILNQEKFGANSQFGKKIFVCKIVNKSLAKKNLLSISNIYSNKIDNLFVLKDDVEQCEIELLKLAKFKDLNKFIVEIIGDCIDVFKTKIFLEMCNNTVQEYFFEKASYNLEAKHLQKKLEFKQFLVYMARVFFQKVLTFLLSENIVYADWKFDNILLFYGDSSQIYNSIVNVKLCDFGSVQKANIEIKNVNNINPFFSSPYLNKIFDTIIPTHFDDFKSICYLLYVLNGKPLPWSNINLTKIHSSDIFIDLIVHITNQKFKTDMHYLDTDQCLYWPSMSDNTSCEKYKLGDIFSCLNKNFF